MLTQPGDWLFRYCARSEGTDRKGYPHSSTQAVGPGSEW
jgi:hypothetical protein